MTNYYISIDDVVDFTRTYNKLEKNKKSIKTTRKKISNIEKELLILSCDLTSEINKAGKLESEIEELTSKLEYYKQK